VKPRRARLRATVSGSERSSLGSIIASSENQWSPQAPPVALPTN
jgi:hypothetical protein